MSPTLRQMLPAEIKNSLHGPPLSLRFGFGGEDLVIEGRGLRPNYDNSLLPTEQLEPLYRLAGNNGGDVAPLDSSLGPHDDSAASILLSEPQGGIQKPVSRQADYGDENSGNYLGNISMVPRWSK